MKTIRRVFLAGKITGNMWRAGLVSGDLSLHPKRYDCMITEGLYEGIGSFPVYPRSILSLLDYVGPFSVCLDEQACACSSSAHNHGAWRSEVKTQVIRANEEAIASADVVFAWLDDPSASATLYELGYAAALGKEVWVAGPRAFPEFGLLYAGTFSDVCEEYPYEGDPEGASGDPEPRTAFVRMLEARLCGHSHPPHWGRMTVDPAVLASPIEEQFLRAWNAANPEETQADGPRYYGLFPQYPIDGGRYRLDFAVLGTRLAIELDGLRAHQSTEQIAYDRKRQREIEGLGWRVIRFGGKEVYQSPEECVAEVRVLVDRQDAEHGRRVVAEAREWLAQYQQWRATHSTDALSATRVPVLAEQEGTRYG